MTADPNFPLRLVTISGSIRRVAQPGFIAPTYGNARAVPPGSACCPCSLAPAFTRTLQKVLPPIRVISSMATREILLDLSQRFEKQSPHRVLLESVGGVDAEQRVKNAEHFDVVILASGAVDRLAAAASLEPGSTLEFVQSSLAVAVRQGADKIDIRSESALRKAVTDAKSIRSTSDFNN